MKILDAFEKEFGQFKGICFPTIITLACFPERRQEPMTKATQLVVSNQSRRKECPPNGDQEVIDASRIAFIPAGSPQLLGLLSEFLAPIYHFA